MTNDVMNATVIDIYRSKLDAPAPTTGRRTYSVHRSDFPGAFVVKYDGPTSATSGVVNVDGEGLDILTAGLDRNGYCQINETRVPAPRRVRTRKGN